MVFQQPQISPKQLCQGSAACPTSSSQVQLTQQLQNSFQTGVLRKTGTSMGFQVLIEPNSRWSASPKLFKLLPLSFHLWPLLMSLAFCLLSVAAVVSLFHAWSPFFLPSASSSGYHSMSHLFRRGSAGIVSPLEYLWEWSIFGKIHFLLLDHERVIYHMKTFANNNSGLLPSIQFFYTTFHTKIYQALVLLVRFYLPCAGSFHFWCVLVLMLSDNFWSVKTQECSQ